MTVTAADTAGCRRRDDDEDDVVALAQRGVGGMVRSPLQAHQRLGVTHTVQAMVSAMISWISSPPNVDAATGDDGGVSCPAEAPSDSDELRPQRRTTSPRDQGLTLSV